MLYVTILFTIHSPSWPRCVYSFVARWLCQEKPLLRRVRKIAQLLFIHLPWHAIRCSLSLDSSKVAPWTRCVTFSASPSAHSLLDSPWLISRSLSPLQDHPPHRHVPLYPGILFFTNSLACAKSVRASLFCSLSIIQSQLTYSVS